MCRAENFQPQSIKSKDFNDFGGKLFKTCLSPGKFYLAGRYRRNINLMVKAPQGSNCLEV